LDPIVGREKELQRIAQILSRERRTILSDGEPGVGKSAIAEGLALRLFSESLKSPFQQRLFILTWLAGCGHQVRGSLKSA
jgi:ATP-dependent Clp protease ATP-binding subunit ClpA